MSLRRDGFCVVPDILDRPLLARLRARTAALLARLPVEHRRNQRATGSLVHIAADPAFAELIAWPKALAALAAAGLGGARFSSGYVISKPAAGPPLFWHQDWWGWDHPSSYGGAIHQVFLMYYLADTSIANGCLRVVPGSHRKRHRLHELLPGAHAERLARAADPGDPAFAAVGDERAVPVRAGDLVIGDARLLHGAYANRPGAERPLITLWYHPHFARQPAAIRARTARILHRDGVDTDPAGGDTPFPEGWPKAARARIAPLLADYDGRATPLPWNRNPDPRRLAGAA
jgi:ectoine hydroxylase-related dioxygenase (phytanoyl-CoA dioxygenase family)